MSLGIKIILLLLFLFVVALFFAAWKVYQMLMRLERDITNEVHRTQKELSAQLRTIFSPFEKKEEAKPRKEAKPIPPKE